MKDNFEKKNPSLTINEMWGLVKKQENWGIEGYEVPKYYPDATKQAIRDRERNEKNSQHRREWPPKDWPVNENKKSVPPKRPNYLDQVDKWANSFYDPLKRSELIKALNERTHPYDDEPKDEIPRNLRSEFLKNEGDKNTLYKQRAKAEKERIKQAEEVLKAKHSNSEAKTKDQIIKEKYKLFGSLPKCDRISIVSDAEYMGEQNPFYNTYDDPKKEEQKVYEDNDGNKKKNRKNLFYPSKTATWRKAPIWSINKIHGDNNPYVKNREKMYMEELQKSFENKTRKRELSHFVDVRGTFEKQQNFKKVFFKYKEPIDYASSNEYKIWKQNFPDLYPGPQHYWKEPPLNLANTKRKSDDEEGKAQTEEDKQKRYMNRAKTDRRVYKPMKQHVF